MGNIFSFILHNKDFNADYTGKYKDQKAFLYFNSEFFGSVFIYEPKSKQRENTVFLHSEVRASQTVDGYKQLWITVKNIHKNGSIILSAWGSCMAGSSETCNHVIATLNKIDCAHTKGWRYLACTETTCQWNRGTRKEVEPKRITVLTYLLGKNWGASKQTLMTKIVRKLGWKTQCM